MSDFTAIGQLVTEARNLLDSIKGGAIRTMQTQFDALIVSITNKFNGKLVDYQSQVSAITKPSKAVIASSMDLVVYVDPVNGSDSLSGTSASDAFKTLGAAIDYVPNNATVKIIIVNDESSLLVVDASIRIGARNVYLHTGHVEINNTRAFISDGGNLWVRPRSVTFSIKGDVTLFETVRKSTLSLGGYEGAKFTLSDGASLTLCHQTYSSPASMVEVSAHRLSCLDSAGQPTTRPVRMFDFSYTGIGLVNAWQCTFGSDYKVTTSSVATENVLGNNLKLVSVG